MAVSALTKTFGGTTIETTEEKYEALVRKGEQLRILRNFIMLDSTFSKSEVVNLINAIELNTEAGKNE